MTLFRPALYALILWPAMASPGFTAEGAGSAAADSCDIVCQMQSYLNADHMVRLVPAPELADRSARKQANPRPRTRLAETARPSLRRIVEAAPNVTLPPRRSAARSALRHVAQLIPSVAAPPPESPPPVRLTTPIIPGAAPVMMSRFASPSADAPR